MRAFRWFAATLSLTALAGGSLASASPLQRPLDDTFGFHGKVTTRIGEESVASAVAQQRDGKIVVAGWTHTGDNWDVAVARYRRNGALDHGFGRRGVVTTDFGSWDLASAMKLQRDGKILVAGEGGTTAPLVIARYMRSGSLDRTFGVGGKVTAADASAQAMVVQPDGKIVTGGGFQGDFVLSRFMPNGSRDGSFGTDGTARMTFPPWHRSGVHGLVVQRDGKIVAVGVNWDHEIAQWAIARFLQDGRPDPSFGTNGTVTLFFEALSGSSAFAVALQRDGTIVIAGDTPDGPTLVRLRGDGTIRSTWRLSLGDPCCWSPREVRVQRDGKIVIGGATYDGHGHGDFIAARYTPHGRLDTTFWAGGKLTTSITPASDGATALVLQRDGKLVLAGFAGGTDFGPGATTFALVRYAKR